jgi:hypothetical protein
MSRLGISVEGATEREFVSRILRPHLTAFGWTQVVGVDLGGNVSLDKIAGVLPRLLGSFDHVSTFYDYYGFKYRNGMSVEALEAATRACDQLEWVGQRHSSRVWRAYKYPFATMPRRYTRIRSTSSRLISSRRRS